METISDLNALLASFKATRKALVPFDLQAEEDNRSEQKRTYLENRASQNALYHALITRANNQLETGFRLRKGEQGVIGTVGSLTNGSMLYYAEAVGSQCCMSGISLMAIVEFLDSQ